MAFVVATEGRSQVAARPTPEQDFSDLKMMTRPLPVTPAVVGRQKTTQEFKQEQQMQSSAFVAAAAKANDFYTKNPNHANAGDAKQIEAVSLLRAVQTGAVTEEPKALRLAGAYRADKAQPSANRYAVATLMVQMDVQKKKIKDLPSLMAEHERQAVNLLGEFPNEPGVYDTFLGIARNSDPVRARSVAQRVLLMPAPAAAKEQARAVIDRLDMPGSAPALEWVDESGASRRIGDYKGKIVVFYLWATWSPDSVAALSTVAAAIKPGVELISVNVDSDLTKGKDAKKKTVLPGGSYSDDRGLQSPLPLQLKADQVPAVHVINAKGVYVGTGLPTALSALLQQAAK